MSDDLIARLEAAPEGNADLSWKIAETLGWARFWAGETIYVLPGEYADRVRKGSDTDWYDWPRETFAVFQNFTTSLDVALTLVPENWFLWRLAEVVTPAVYRDSKHERLGFVAELQHRDGGRLKSAGRSVDMYGPVGRRGTTYPKTAPLAICIAALKARKDDHAR